MIMVTKTTIKATITAAAMTTITTTTATTMTAKTCMTQCKIRVNLGCTEPYEGE